MLTLAEKAPRGKARKKNRGKSLVKSPAAIIALIVLVVPCLRGACKLWWKVPERKTEGKVPRDPAAIIAMLLTVINCQQLFMNILNH